MDRRKKIINGFTLVEVALVLVVVGLLIGGVLKGREIKTAAEIKATWADAVSYRAAMIIFHDIYDAIPGDMVGASTKIPGCNAACDATDTTGGVVFGDGKIGVTDGSGLEDFQSMNDTEPTLFWTHLYLSNLIAGLTDAAIQSGYQPHAGQSHPFADVGGVFHVKHGTGGTLSSGGVQPSGTILVLQGQANGRVDMVPMNKPLTAKLAATIDRKYDDGSPQNGDIIAFGLAGNASTDCMSAYGQASSYLSNSRQQTCGLMFQLRE